MGFVFLVPTVYTIRYQCFEESGNVLLPSFGEDVPNDANAFASNLPVEDDDDDGDDFGGEEEKARTKTSSGGEEEEDEDDEGAGWMETLERGVGGGVLVSRDSWMCVEGEEAGRGRGTGRDGTGGEARSIGVGCPVTSVLFKETAQEPARGRRGDAVVVVGDFGTLGATGRLARARVDGVHRGGDARLLALVAPVKFGAVFVGQSGPERGRDLEVYVASDAKI